MKLKRLLSGVTAAIMALSSVAIASFTSASASELADNAPIQWTGKWQKQNPDIFTTTSSKGGILAEDFGGSWQMCISEFSFDGMENPTIEIEFDGTDTFQVATTDEKGEAFNEIGNGTSGQSVLIAEKYRSETRFLLSTGADTGVITKVSIYDDPNPPAQPEAFESIDYNCTIVSGGDTTVTFGDPEGTNKSSGLEVGTSGDFKLERKFATTPISLSGLGVIEASPNPVTVKVNSIVVNGKYTFDVGLEIASDSEYGNALPHIYDGTTTKTAVIYKCADAYIAGGSNIKLMLGAPPEASKPGQSQSSSNTYSGTTYDAQLSYFIFEMDARGNDKTYGGPIAEIGGTYTLGINISDFKNWSDQVASGAVCLYVDINGLAAAFGANTENGTKADPAMALAKSKGISVTNLSILTDGNTFYKFKDSDILFGDFEGNGNLRIDIYNEYTEAMTKCPIDLLAILPNLLASESIELSFTITTPLTPGVNPSSVTSVNPTKAPATTVNAKKAAQAKVKNAKIKNLSVKSKAKKKISVSWKKVNKVNGYQVQVATKKNFKGKNIILKKFTKKAKLTVKSPKIKSKKSYFVRVRAYATYKNSKNKTDKVYGKFSTKKKVKVK